MQWTTTDFMGLEPKELFCEYIGCTDYQEVLVKGNIKDKLENYRDIFPNTMKYYGENTTTFAAELSIAQPFCTINVPLNDNGFCYWSNVTRNKNKHYTCKSNDQFIYSNSFKFKSLVNEFDLV